MAAPVVQQAVESSTNTAGTSHTVTLPTATANQLLLIILDKGSTSATINAHGSLTELLDEASANGLYIAYRWMDGTEPSSYTLTSSASTRSAVIAYRISGAINPAAVAPQIGSTGSGTSATPDPPASATPPSSKDYLFIAFAGMAGEEADDDTWGNTPPTNYTPSPPRQKSCGTAGTNLGGLILSAERALTTGSAEDPGTFGVDTSAAWRSQTITIHPQIPQLVTPTTASLSTATFAPTVSTTANQRLTPTTAGLTTSAFALTVLAPRLVTASTVSLITSTFAPTVTVSDNQSVTPTTASLTLTTFEPTVTIEAQDITVTPTTGSLSTSTFAPTIVLPKTVIPSTSSLSLSTFAPTVLNPRTVTPATASLSTATFAPVIASGVRVTPEIGSLTTATFAPTVSATQHQRITPTTLNLMTSTLAPAVTASAHQTVTPQTAALTLMTFAPRLGTVLPMSRDSTATLTVAVNRAALAVPASDQAGMVVPEHEQADVA